MNKYFIGIDIGSTCAKTVVMNHEKEILHRFLQPTGWSSVDTAKQIQETLMEKGILSEKSVVVATGYGRVSVPYAAKGSGTSISSMCTVFAESEVISLIGRGESRENIAFAVIDSIVQKVVSQAARLTNGQEECICLTGGLCDYSYLKKSLGESLKTDVLTDTDGRYAGAIGAAIAAITI